MSSDYFSTPTYTTRGTTTENIDFTGVPNEKYYSLRLGRTIFAPRSGFVGTFQVTDTVEFTNAGRFCVLNERVVDRKTLFVF